MKLRLGQNIPTGKDSKDSGEKEEERFHKVIGGMDTRGLACVYKPKEVHAPVSERDSNPKTSFTQAP